MHVRASRGQENFCDRFDTHISLRLPPGGGAGIE
jgi:hypothetical protein